MHPKDVVCSLETRGTPTKRAHVTSLPQPPEGEEGKLADARRERSGWP